MIRSCQLETSRSAVAIGLCAWLALAASAHAQTTIKIVPQADLKNLDPVWTTAEHGATTRYMIYDTLFALDSKRRAAAADGRRLRNQRRRPDLGFALRDGLKFHDGSPVEAKDAVASFGRWSAALRRYGDAGSRDQSLPRSTPEPSSSAQATLRRRRSRCSATRRSARRSCARPRPRPTPPSGDGRHRLGAVQVRRGPVGPRRQGRLRQVPDYVPRAEPVDGFAGGKLVQGRQGRAGSSSPTRTPRPQALHLRARSTPTRSRQSTCCRRSRPTRTSLIRVLDPLGKMGHIRPNLPVPAVRQRQGAPGLAAPGRPAGVPRRPGRQPHVRKSLLRGLHVRFAVRDRCPCRALAAAGQGAGERADGRGGLQRRAGGRAGADRPADHLQQRAGDGRPL